MLVGISSVLRKPFTQQLIGTFPMALGRHAVMCGSTMSGSQLWVLVGAPMYDMSTSQPTNVTFKRESAGGSPY